VLYKDKLDKYDARGPATAKARSPSDERRVELAGAGHRCVHYTFSFNYCKLVKSP